MTATLRHVAWNCLPAQNSGGSGRGFAMPQRPH